MALDPAAADEGAEWVATAALKQGDFERAEAVLRARLLSGAPGREDRALRALVAVLREQGRWPEALAAARRFRALPPTDVVAAPTRASGGAPGTALLEAQVLLEAGRPRAAAALFDSIARGADGATPAALATGPRAHRATALAAAGDTGALARLADTLALAAAARGTAVARRQAAYARGLSLLARGDHAAAADTLARAIGSPNLGYTRANLARAGALVALGRAREAVAVLQPALRGTIDGEGTYTTHVEVHGALAHAWRAAGSADSAAAHAAWVVRARGAGRSRPLLARRPGAGLAP
jgi:tetratricopeptide (TPR) repeat protein